jgi:hypothetical protein
MKLARCFNSGNRFKKQKSPRRGRLKFLTFRGLHLLKTKLPMCNIAAFQMILDRTKIQSSPGGDSIDLLIASPAVETAGYFHSPFRAWVFSPSGGCVSDRFLRHGKQRICLQFGDTTDSPFSDLLYCRMSASEMPKPGGRMKIARCFNSGKRFKKTEKSPQGTTEIFDIPRNASSENQALLPQQYCGIPNDLGWNKRFSRPLAGTRLIY